jgi:hypothetical protein
MAGAFVTGLVLWMFWLRPSAAANQARREQARILAAQASTFSPDTGMAIARIVQIESTMASGHRLSKSDQEYLESLPKDDEYPTIAIGALIHAYHLGMEPKDRLLTLLENKLQQEIDRAIPARRRLITGYPAYYWAVLSDKATTANTIGSLACQQYFSTLATGSQLKQLLLAPEKKFIATCLASSDPEDRAVIGRLIVLKQGLWGPDRAYCANIIERELKRERAWRLEYWQFLRRVFESRNPTVTRD